MPALLYLTPKGDLEVHLLTEQGTFYEQVMHVGFIDFLRPHKEFAREEELRQQIQADLAAARRYFGLQ
jgi:FAD synthase